MNKTETKIYNQIKKDNGVCHAGTISMCTNYTLATCRRVMAKLEGLGIIENIPGSDGISCWYVKLND